MMNLLLWIASSFLQDSTEDQSKAPFPTAYCSVPSPSAIRDRASTAPESALRNFMNDNKPSESGDSPGSSGHCFECRAVFTSVLKRRVSMIRLQVKVEFRD